LYYYLNPFVLSCQHIRHFLQVLFVRCMLDSVYLDEDLIQVNLYVKSIQVFSVF
jgi:hypothetical protein